MESYVSDGPYLSGERSLLSSIIPAAGWRPRDDATYYPVPWLLSTPMVEAPLLVRAGALLPLLSPDVETLAGGGRGVVHLADRLGKLRVLAFPRGRSHAAMFARERLRSREGPSGWRLAVDGARRRRIGLQASLGTLHRPFAPCALRVDGRRLPARAWRYDAQTRVLRARFAVGRGVLEALRRGQAGCDG